MKLGLFSSSRWKAGGFADSAHFRAFLAAALFAAAACFSHVHQGSLWVDSVRYAHIAHLAEQSGTWFPLYDEFKDAQYHNKPPLLLWLVAISYKCFGVSSFSARLPAAIFVFCGLLLLWKVVARYYSHRAAYVALFLFCANRVFLRGIIDLNFEGMILCAALLCLPRFLNAIRGEALSQRDLLLFGCGLLLLLQSKPPYIFFLLFPMLVLGAIDARLRDSFVKLATSKITIGFFLLGLSWLLLSGKVEIQRMLSNQIAHPLTIEKNYWTNLSRWMRAVFLEFAPLSWVGLLALRAQLRGAPCGPAASARLERIFYLAWLAPAAGVILLVEHQSRYLILPFLTLTIFGANYLAALCSRVRSRHFAVFCKGSSVACFAAFCVFGLRAHTDNGAVSILRKHPELVGSPVAVCVRGEDNISSKPTRKRMIMLLELEFAQKFPVAMYQTIGRQKIAPGSVFIAEKECLRLLTEHSTILTVLESKRGFSLVRLDSELPEITRSGEDDSAFHAYH
ncbi:MAG: glycosyltransferase family 39 protein [Deltaproteobacteria bacterium]|nr:glycosyltransferase family 39 protein [Deltaproteobacteria bacterium]